MGDTKIALFIGGAGNIGSSTITAFLEKGGYKHLVMISRQQERIESAIARIREKVGSKADQIIGIVGDVSAEDGGPAVREKVVAAVGDKIDTVVSVVGWPYLNYGPLQHVSFDKLDYVFRSQFYAAFGGYRTFMPLVQKSSCGTYVFVTGGGPDMYIGPGTGVMTLGGSTTTALAKVVMKEHATDQNVCCTEVSFQLGIYPDLSMGPPGIPAITTADAGKLLCSVASRRLADLKTISIRSAENAQTVIASGKQE